MAMPMQNSSDNLCAEILADARRECDEILRRAKAAADEALARAKAEADKIRRERNEEAQVEAARRTGMILATVAVETGRLRSARVEALLESVRIEIRRRLLAENSNVHETLVALAADAIRHMSEGQFVVEISSAAREVSGNGLAQEIIRRTGRSPLNLTVSTDGAVTDGGVMIRDAAGFQFWDNRLLSRLDRLWPELRRQIAVQTSLVTENNSTGAGA